MSYLVMVHIANDDPIMCEIEALPTPQDQLITIRNPRRRDGKDVHYLDEDVTTVVFPYHRITMVQVLPTSELEEVIGFVRER